MGYKDDRKRTSRMSLMMGLLLTIMLHLCVILFGAMRGLSYLYPPPQEKAVLVDFTEIEENPIKPKRGKEPKSVNPDPTKPLELTQRSEAQQLGTKQNETEEATVGKEGDVEVPEPPREKEINKKALFHSANNEPQKDSLAHQVASEVSDELKEGHASGTTDHGKTVGEPNARLAGRNPVSGALPYPQAKFKVNGTIVVDIKVDQYGMVTSATVNAEKSDITDKSLWNAAIKAAKESRFDQKANAPVEQQGTITYKFTIRK